MTNAEYRDICLGKFVENRALYENEILPSIEAHRKGNMTLCLTDKNGNPLKHTAVSVRQTTHDFKYGANIFMLDEFETAEENARYRELFSQYFNLATVPFYWDGLEPEQGKPRYAADSPKVYRRPAPDLCLAYCQEKNILAKLHCLFYERWIPDWLPKDNEAEMIRLYQKRFKEISERYADKLYEVEVLNELLLEQRWTGQSVLSKRRDVIEWAFALARDYFPHNTLVFNEAGNIPQLGKEDYRAAMFMMLDAALLRGADIDKIGVQNHIHCGARCPIEEDVHNYARYFDPVLQWEGLKTLSVFGKPLEITEVTIPSFGEGADGEEIQAELLRYLYTLWFAVPQMETVVYWNTIEDTGFNSTTVQWNENNCRGGLLRRDFSEKPAGRVLRELFTKEWHTDLALTTDENGCVSFRGFYGDYTVCANGNTAAFGIHKNATKTTEVQL